MFIAYTVALDAVRLLQPLIVAIGRRDADLADQLSRASASVPLNLAEGRSRRGGDRTHHFRIARGSACESRAALDVAVARALVAEAEARPAWLALDRVSRLVWPLTK